MVWALEMDLPELHSCSKTHVHKIINVPVFYMARELNGFNDPLLEPLEGLGPENCDFFGPKLHSIFKMITSRAT
jgi:hypothetical protein